MLFELALVRSSGELSGRRLFGNVSFDFKGGWEWGVGGRVGEWERGRVGEGERVRG